MKVKISITLTDGVLSAIDRNIGAFKSRSGFIEFAARQHLARIARVERYQKNLEMINRKAVSLNREANDVLAFMVPT